MTLLILVSLTCIRYNKFSTALYKKIMIIRFSRKPYLEHNTPVFKELMKILKLPADHYKNILTLIKLQNYAPLINRLSQPGRMLIAVHLINDVLDSNTTVSTPEDVSNYYPSI